MRTRPTLAIRAALEVARAASEIGDRGTVQAALRCVCRWRRCQEPSAMDRALVATWGGL